MSQHFLPRAHRTHVCLGFALAAFAAGVMLIAAPCTAWAQSPTVTRIEEDWVLVVGDPDPNTIAPQITCVMSPVADTESVYAAFNVNHRSVPEFEPGGLQLQVWSYDEPFTTAEAMQTESLETPGETITWTQRMTVDDGYVTFGVVNGVSNTWGAFDTIGELSTTVPAGVNNLNGYTPNFSADQSGVGYAANRVGSLVLKEVRYYSSEGLVLRDTTPKVVCGAE